MMRNPIRTVGASVVDLFAHPGGRAARPMAHALNFFNRRSGQRASAALGVHSGDRVLEVGFGGGAAIPSTLRTLGQHGQLCAIDLSRDMVALAAQRFTSAVRDGRLLLVCADVSALPLSGEAFDFAYALHSHMYWPSPIGGVSEIYRVLRPGGRLLLAMDTVAGIPLIQRFGSDYRPLGPDQLIDLFTGVGFRNIATQKLARGVVTVTGDRV